MHRKAGEKIVFMDVNSHTYGRQSNDVLRYGRKSSVAIQQLVETWSRSPLRPTLGPSIPQEYWESTNRQPSAPGRGRQSRVTGQLKTSLQLSKAATFENELRRPSFG